MARTVRQELTHQKSLSPKSTECSSEHSASNGVSVACDGESNNPNRVKPKPINFEVLTSRVYAVSSGESASY